jgi:hypothetical protein
MSTDYAERERDFIASLNEDTGRDLDGWMAAISESGFSERNAIIDWLRHQGFQFAWASWLERIHHNGGRLIYADAIEQLQSSTRPDSPARAIDDEPPQRQTITVADVIAPPERRPSNQDVQRLLAGAKGLRPLAEHILRQVASVVPDVEQTATNAFITMSAPLPFAALLPSPKKLRLFADFGKAGEGRAKAAEAINRAPPPFPDMLLLDDARSIDEEFRRLVRAAAGR